MFFLSVVGIDDEAKIIRKELEQNGINCEFIEDNSRHTTLKKDILLKIKNYLE